MAELKDSGARRDLIGERYYTGALSAHLPRL